MTVTLVHSFDSFCFHWINVSCEKPDVSCLFDRNLALRSCYLTKVKLFVSASLAEIRILPRGTLNLAIRF